MMRTLSLVSVRASLVCAIALVAFAFGARESDGFAIAANNELSVENDDAVKKLTPERTRVRKIAENQYEIDRVLVDNALSDLSSSSCSRIVPAFEEGKPTGFKLFSIRPGSLAAKLGIQNADVIRRFNGHEINSPDNALKVYENLVASDHVVVDITRRGVPITFEYTIVDNQEVQK